MGQSINRKTI